MASHTAPSRLVLKALAPPDRARSAVLRATGQRLTPWLRSREARVRVLAVGGVLSALILTLGFPAELLLLGPLVLGVPHLLSDVRYLIVREGLHRHPLFLAAILLPAAATLVWPHLQLGLVTIGAATAVLPGRLWRKAIVLVLLLPLVLLANAYPWPSALLFAHGHNVVAVIIFVMWCKHHGQARGHQGMLFAFGLASLLLLTGALEPVLFELGFTARALSDPQAGAAFANLAPMGMSPTWTLRLGMFFVFAQSVHYAVWLRLVPEQARPKQGVRGFRATYIALERDMGRWFLATTVLVAVGLVVWGMIDAWAARDGYLRLALFHGPMELAVLAYWFIRR